jgi:hypothetical protein
VNPRRSPSGIFGCHSEDQVRISSLTLGWPLRRRDRQRQYKRKPARCHPTNVSGFTMTTTSDQRGHRQEVPQSGPEQAVEAGQRGPRPLSLEHGDLLPYARTSKEVSTRLRKNTRTAATNAVIKRSTYQPS